MEGPTKKLTVTGRDGSAFVSADIESRRFLWWHGPVIADGDYLKLHLADGQEYEPMATGLPAEIADALQRVRTAEDAEGFVERYGPLRVGFKAGDDFEEIAGYAPPSWLSPPKDVRRIALRPARPSDDWIALASDIIDHGEIIKWVFTTTTRVRQAHNGQSRALKYLREEFQHLSERQALDSAFLFAVTERLGSTLSSGVLARSHLRLCADAPGRFTMSVQPTSLLEVAYFGAALRLLDERLAQCKECGATFSVRRSGMECCSDQCSSRRRQRKHRKKILHQQKGVR